MRHLGLKIDMVIAGAIPALVSTTMRKIYRVHHPIRPFSFIADETKVIEAQAALKWMDGKPLDFVLNYYKKKKTKVDVWLGGSKWQRILPEEKK